jgi:simple sugar transport system permease protein
MDDAQWLSLLASTFRVSAPLVFCALAGLLSERAGVIDLGLEGKMLLSAFAAGAAGALAGSLTAALGAALLVGFALSMLHGFACVTHRGDQVVLGIALTMTAAGLSVVLAVAWFGQGGQTPPLPNTLRFLPVWFGQNYLVYLALGLVPVIWFFLFRTTIGLRLRATGENPAMVEAAGLSVPLLRYGALAINGLLCGLAGSYLVLAQGANFSPHMTAGRGYMALAAMIFGKWHPVGALGACLLFGFLDAAAIRLQGVSIALPGLGDSMGVVEIPVQAIQALPYVMTVLLLAGFVGHARAPAALGIPR